jgi:hypothetical protein
VDATVDNFIEVYILYLTHESLLWINFSTLLNILAAILKMAAAALGS